MLKVSQRGLAEIAGHEAVVLSPYKDASGLWTIGIGHLMEDRANAEREKRRELSMREAISLFMKDIEQFETRVRKAFRRSLTQKQFDAAVSFDFNTGGVHRASWVRHFNEGRDERAKKAFMLWRKPAKVVPRREKERTLFFDGSYHHDGRVFIYPVSASGYPLWSKGRRCDFLEELQKFLEERDSGEKSAPRVGEAAERRRVLPKRTVEIEDEPVLLRPQQDEDVSRFLMRRFSYLTPEERRADKVKLLMLRGYFANAAGGGGRNERGRYDDALFVISPGGIQAFNGNADPSAFRKGIATIKAFQAVRYRPGLHGYARKDGPYPAFRQDAPCTVERDGEGDDTGMFAVNLHRGGAEETQSAGCLTVPPLQWEEFHPLLSSLLARYGQETFFVTLVLCSKEEAMRQYLGEKEQTPEGRRMGSLLSRLLQAAFAFLGSPFRFFWTASVWKGRGPAVRDRRR